MTPEEKVAHDALLEKVKETAKTEIETRGYQNKESVQALLDTALKGLPMEALRAFDGEKLNTSIKNIAAELEKVKKVLSTFGDMGDAVGIYVLSDQDTIFNKDRSREPQEYNDLLDHTSIFKLLRKREYENVILHYFRKLPQSDPVFHFKVCLEQFLKIPILDVQKSAFKELKKRNKITVEEFDKIQPELKSVIYFSGLVRKMPKLEQLLQKKYGG